MLVIKSLIDFLNNNSSAITAKIKDFKTTNFDDPEYICVIAENKDRCIKENLYIRKDFLNDYDFIKVTEKASKIDLSFIISKNKIMH